MGIPYSATLAIDQPTRAFLKTNGYTLYLFKGINAGKGATSTVWLTVTGNQLYDQAANTITWSEDYYIGEESTEIQNGAAVDGTNPYITSNNIQSVSLGKNYTFPGTAWNPQATDQPSNDTFTILNTEQSVNNFYVSQKTTSGPEDYIVVKSLLGSGELGTFEPIETVAMILGTQAYSTGTMITQAFSPGAIVTLPGITAASLAYDQSTGWSATAGELAHMQLGDAVYDSMLNAAAASVATQMARARARWQRLGGGDQQNDTVINVKWNAPVSENGGGLISGTITVKSALVFGFTAFIIASIHCRIKRITRGTIVDFEYNGPLTLHQLQEKFVQGAIALFTTKE